MPVCTVGWFWANHCDGIGGRVGRGSQGGEVHDGTITARGASQEGAKDSMLAEGGWLTNTWLMKSYRELDPLRRVAHESGGQAGVEPDDKSRQVTVVAKAIMNNRVHRELHITVKAYVLWSGLSVSEPTMGTHTSEEPAKQCQQSERLMGTQQADAEMFEQHAGAAHSSAPNDQPTPRKHMNQFTRGRRDTWQRECRGSCGSAKGRFTHPCQTRPGRVGVGFRY